MTIHQYKAFGLIFSSDTPLPSLAGSSIPGAVETPDVAIRHETLVMPPETVTLDDCQFARHGDDVILHIDEIGIFRISGGRSIVIHPDPGATAEQIHLFLLGSIFGIILYQRDVLPMHSNAIEVGGQAFLFCGDSGAGKSTLAAYFEGKGYRILTDDVTALHFGVDGLIAEPGIARLKLWRNSLELFGRSDEGLKQLPWHSDKFELPVVPSSLAGALPVGGIYHLRIADSSRPSGIHRLSGLDSANTVTANIYRRRFADLMGKTSGYLSNAMRIASQVPIFTINRVWGLDHFRTEAAAAEAHLWAIAGTKSE